MGTLKEMVKGILIGLIANAIWLFISVIANYFGWNFPFNLLLMQLPLWIVLLAIIILIPSIVMVMRAKRRYGGVVLRVPKRPRHHVTKFDADMFEVKWKVLYGTFYSIGSEPYAFCESHPFCPECMYEMEAEKRGLIFKRYYWKCDDVANSINVQQSIPTTLVELLKKYWNQR